MRVLLAISADDYLARGPDDDMKWTGRADKQTFRLLTSIDTDTPLLAGSVTARLMPALPGRKVLGISRGSHLTLEKAFECFPQAWLIGGLTVVLAALDAGMVDKVYLSRSPETLGGGIHAAPLLGRMPLVPCQMYKALGAALNVYIPHTARRQP